MEAKARLRLLGRSISPVKLTLGWRPVAMIRSALLFDLL